MQHSKETNKAIIKEASNAAKVQETRGLITLIRQKQAAEKRA